jgi:hypothetical protein
LGLDIYVGPLCRYYSGDWATIMFWLSQEGGAAADTLMAKDPHSEDSVALRPTILEWRAGLARKLGDCLRGPLDWREDPACRYYTDKPGRQAYGGLLFWASYASWPDKEPHPHFDPDKWETDVSLDALQPPAQDDLTDQLWCRTWLPCRMEGTHQMDAPLGDEPLFVGSVEALVAALDEINARTWRAGPEQIAEWSRRGPPIDENGDLVPLLRPWAEFGFSIFDQLARTALRERLPMLLDW